MLQVYIIGHTPPGIDEHDVGIGGLSDEHNFRYLRIVREFADMIKGQFFGHLHSDTFRLIYNDASKILFLIIKNNLCYELLFKWIFYNN